MQTACIRELSSILKNKTTETMHLKPIIQGKFRRFREAHGLENMKDGIAFERFVNHAVLTTHQPDAFTADSDFLEKVCVGGESDTGIDGIAIKINGILIRSKEDINNVMSRPKDVSVEFIFIQSKYKPNFDLGEFLKFVAGVRNFLSDQQRAIQNEKVAEWTELKNYIFSENFIAKWDSNPNVRLYYVAMGTWRNDKNILANASQAKDDVVALNTYEVPEIVFLDEEGIKNVCDSNENRFTAQIPLEGFMELTHVDNVDNSCIAICYAGNFLKILTSENGDIRKALFDDNVRDYQGENAVNNEISRTIEKDPSKFILLNNGITIVCDKFQTASRKITIENPQIVNGCQTSHVIFYAHKRGLDVSRVPLNIKIIATQDINISNQIVRGTNRQSQVTEEAFETTKKFHQNLEEFFTAISTEPYKLYYERRSRQYRHDARIKTIQIIKPEIVMQSIFGMFLNRPHDVKPFALMLREYRGEIFLERHSLLPYFVSSLAFFHLESLFRDEIVTKDLRPYKPHLLMMFREVIAGSVPSINSTKLIDEHCEKIRDVLKNTEKTKEIFLKVVDVFRRTRDIWVNDKKRSKDGMKDVSEFTELLLSQTRSTFSVKKTDFGKQPDDTYQSKVLFTKTDKNGNWFGFISKIDEDGDNIFFHSNQNTKLDFADLRGKKVEFTLGKNPVDKKLIALNVAVI
jgi:cold shock CspA family protein